MATYLLITKRADEIAGGDFLALTNFLTLPGADDPQLHNQREIVEDVYRSGMSTLIVLRGGKTITIRPDRHVGVWQEL